MTWQPWLQTRAKLFFRTWRSWGCRETTRLSETWAKTRILCFWRSKGAVLRIWEAIWHRCHRQSAKTWLTSATFVNLGGTRRYWKGFQTRFDKSFINFSFTASEDCFAAQKGPAVVGPAISLATATENAEATEKNRIRTSKWNGIKQVQQQKRVRNENFESEAAISGHGFGL